MAENAERFSLKDHLFNREKVAYLASLFQAVEAQFPAKKFCDLATEPFDHLELKQRIAHIADTLTQFLPEDFKTAAALITRALPPPLDPTRSDDDFGDFILAPLGEYVVRNGLEMRWVPTSLKTLEQITMRFSMEDAIRYFLNKFPEQTIARASKWSTHRNYHVRRLVSEGTRPFLPWSPRVNLDQSHTVPLLDKLHSDPTRYVTRSVANHVNDISKIDPQLAVDLLKRWGKGKQQDQAEMEWMSKHALRTLVKKGHTQALRHLGFPPQPKIELAKFELRSKAVLRGQHLEFDVTIVSLAKQSLMIDYVIDFLKSNGSHSPKTHKLKIAHLGKGETLTLSKRHLFKADATTYRLYPGIHKIQLQINGQRMGREEFTLK